MRLRPRSTVFDPENPLHLQKRNFRNVQVDAIGIGLANAAAPFLPVFLTKLGASNFEVSLLTSMPAVTGLFLAIVIGNFLQRRRNIVPWFGFARLLVVSSYALTGIVPFIVPESLAVQAVLMIWALATLPQIVVNIAFSVVMNAVAGPEGRYELMSRRWSILGLTSSITVALVGQVLNRVGFPLNYQVVFISLSVGGLISFYFSSHLKIPDNVVTPPVTGLSLKQRAQGYIDLVRSQPAFISFTSKRLVYLTGASLSAPLFPLYYVRVLDASEGWIGIFSTVQTAILLVGYFFWPRLSRRRGSRFVLLASTAGMAWYPALTGITHQVELIALYAGLAGIFQAGIDLVFFDELMKTVPIDYSATFVSISQSLQNLSAFIAPLIGAWLADTIGISGGLFVSTAIRLVAVALFFLAPAQPKVVPGDGESS